MKIIYEKSFLKDLNSIWNSKILDKTKNILLDLKEKDNLLLIKNIKKMSWYNNYYRIKLWDYRIWLKYYNNIIYIIRIKHRKDIYKIFP